jgi:hypothetical protein
MRPYTTRALAFALTGIVWPALLVAISVVWPGPGQPADYTLPGGHVLAPSARPPTDRSGSLMHLIIKYNPESASAEVYVDGQEEVPVSRIFWELPQAESGASPSANGTEESGAATTGGNAGAQTAAIPSRAD